MNRKFLPKQVEVLKALDKYRYILYSGAVRAGKTLLLAHAGIRTCLAYPGAIGLMVSYTTPQLRDVVFKTTLQELELYQKAFNEAGIIINLAKWTNSPGNITIKFFNGSEILFRASDEETKLRGLTLDFVGMDEPVDIDESVFKQLMNRLSGGHVKNPFMLLATNPDNENHWIYKYFFKNPTKEYKVVETSTYDNILLPNYKKYIKELEENLDDDWIRRFLKGKWGTFSGQIYKEFNLDVHVTKEVDSMPFTHYIAGVDWGIRNPSAITIIGITRDKRVGVVEEWYQSGKTSDQISKVIENFYRKYNFRRVYVDRTALDLITQLEQLKIPVYKSKSNVKSGIARVKSLLKSNHLFIHPRCKNLIREMQNYRYKKDKFGNLIEEPVKQDDHSCFDRITQVLTLDGWKYFKDLKYTDKVATMNLTTKELEFQTPINIITEYHSGYIYRYDGSLPLAVTPDHKILYSTQHTMEHLYYKKLCDIIENDEGVVYIPKCSMGIKDTNNKWIVDGFLLGFYLTVGYKSILNNEKCIHLYNTNLNVIEKLRESYNSEIEHSKGNYFIMSDNYNTKDIYHLIIKDDFLFNNLPDDEIKKRYIPKEFLFTAGKEELQKCFDGMIIGNGNIDVSGRRIIYNTESKQLANDFQVLCSLLGLSSILYKASDIMYEVCVYTHKDDFYEMKLDKLRKVYYRGLVYSVTVPNGNVLVRRNGKVMFSGNCDSLRYALSTHSTLRLKPEFGYVSKSLWEF